MVKTNGQGWKIGEGSDLRIAVSRLLLIWLTQQTPTSSVRWCRDRRFPKRCGNFNATSLPRKLANSTSRLVAGPMVSPAPDADIGERMNW